MNKEPDKNPNTGQCPPSDGVGENTVSTPSSPQDVEPFPASEDDISLIESALSAIGDTGAESVEKGDGAESKELGEHADPLEESFQVPEEGVSIPEEENPSPQQILPAASEENAREEIHIPNAQCGEEYFYAVGSHIGQESAIAVRYSDDIGDLLYCPDEMAIKGMPQTARDWWVEVELPSRIFRFSCYVNADPRTLWKNIPSDQRVKADKDYKSILSPVVELVGVSYRGRSHANKGTYRDDDFYINSVDGCHFSVVADGAGSAQLSSTGSKVFCQSAGQEFVRLMMERKDQIADLLQELQFNVSECRQHKNLIKCLYEILPAAAYHGRQQLEKLAADNQMPLKKYHTTALLTFSMQVSERWWFCSSFQVGDGITAALSGSDLYMLGVPDTGSFPGETVFVTSDSVFDKGASLANRIKIALCPVRPIIISMTDGITDSYFKDKSLTDIHVWQQLLSEISNENGDLLPVQEICDWLDYYTVQEHDDKTMTIIKFK